MLNVVGGIRKKWSLYILISYMKSWLNFFVYGFFELSVLKRWLRWWMNLIVEVDFLNCLSWNILV